MQRFPLLVLYVYAFSEKSSFLRDQNSLSSQMNLGVWAHESY